MAEQGRLVNHTHHTDYITRVIRVVDDFFPAGTPVPCETFLKGVTRLLDGDIASLTLVRFEPRRRALIAFDSITYNLGEDRASRHRQNMMNMKAWDGDPTAHRLQRRTVRRPEAAYTYSSIDWVHRNGWHDTFAAKVLDAVGYKQTITMTWPLGGRIYGMLTIARFRSQRFSRLDRRVLAATAKTFHKRVIELRGRTLREKLPKSLRQTFDFILSGVSEKEIAHATKRNVNTVHDQVKRLYAHFGVSSRPQLMARFIDMAKVEAMEL